MLYRVFSYFAHALFVGMIANHLWTAFLVGWVTAWEVLRQSLHESHCACYSMIDSKSLIMFLQLLTEYSQHFQGLRRAQHKIETNGSGSDNPRKIDPTMNPITRRPGPGRGRPKKQPQQPTPMPIPSLSAQPGQDGESLQLDETTPDDQPQPSPAVMPDDLHALPESLDLPIKDDALDMSLKEDNDDGQDGPDAKRIKLDNPPQDPSLVDDEAVLALAAHSDAPSVDAYASEYPTAGLTGSDPHSFSYGGET